MKRTIRIASLALVAAVLSVVPGGCDTRSEWPEPGEQLPGWVYDAPFYYEPQLDQQLLAADAGCDSTIPHYYSRELVVPLKRPDASPAACTPRLAVFYSDDHCQTWRKAGYFGIDQAFFSFVAPCDGTYAIRFAGPGIAPLRMYPGIPPHRVLHIDRTPPCVVVTVNPPAERYRVGDAINVSWTVSDAHTDMDGLVTVYEVAPPHTIRVIGTDFPVSGSIGIIVPPGAAECGVRFAVEARDKAGNTGRGFSFLILAPADQSGAAGDDALPVPPAIETAPLHAPLQPVAPAPDCGCSPAGQVAPQPPATVPVDSGVRPQSNVDRVPVVPTPAVPLVDSQPGQGSHPADGVVDPSYRPRLFPTTQRE